MVRAAESVTNGVEVSTPTAVVLGLVSTLALVALHLLAPHIRKLPLVPEHATGSFAGGLAVSYVFLHLLPELAEGNEALREVFGETAERTALTEVGIFLVALGGFSLFYALERVAQRRSGRDHHAAASTEGPARQQTPPAAVFWLHIGAFVPYNAVITYTLPLTYRTGVGFAVLFTIAMGLHFVLSDRGLEEHYGDRFDRWTPRLLLAGALVVGWALAALLAPTTSITVSILLAFLAGSVMLNVFKEELPSARRSSTTWFFVGLGFYAALLLGVTALGGG
ncbi:hypothetical protein [Nocardioides sp. SYSU DS0663]|uniref:hypothetical protein n=1 Tax=Nocardioides sp. SYSU DS0663 TaxID=3416445 RepID=UPI003F4C6E8A